MEPLDRPDSLGRIDKSQEKNELEKRELGSAGVLGGLAAEDADGAVLAVVAGLDMDLAPPHAVDGLGHPLRRHAGQLGHRDLG
jgi:hypothetical protein